MRLLRNSVLHCYEEELGKSPRGGVMPWCFTLYKVPSGKILKAMKQKRDGSNAQCLTAEQVKQ